MTQPTALELSKMLDHSLLNPTLTEAQLVEGCAVAREFNAATAMVLPYFLPMSVDLLAGSSVVPSTVIGFPHGSNTTTIKVAEAKEALVAGAVELDMVVNISKVRNHDWSYVQADIKAVNDITHAHKAKLKVIFENAYLSDDEKIQLCELCAAVNVDWVKTSSLTPDEILGNFRNSYSPRIAVTVDMISTGTDVKAIECVFFMRNVKSAGYFEQMKGRGVRVISPDKLRVVSPSAKAKERFIIVDAVGVCEHDKTDSHTLNRKPSAPLNELLEYVARGGTDPDALTTLAGRLARLQRQFSTDQLAELKELAGGKTFPELAHDLLQAVDPDAQIAAAKKLPGVFGKPTTEKIEKAAEQLAQQAVTPFLKAAFRRRILEIRTQNEQTIDRHTIDTVISAGFDASALEKAKSHVQDFRAWIVEHKDELTALQVLYSGTRPLKLSLKELRQLQDAISRPPLALTPTPLWRAFELVESISIAEDVAAARLRPGESLADLVKLVRHAIQPQTPLEPYAAAVREQYVGWLKEQNIAGTMFTPEQQEWLDRMAEHIATSLAIEPDDFSVGWFSQHGSLGHAHQLFGDRLKPLIAELNDWLAV